ncbi:phosphoglycerate mutase family protein [uncultured Brevundimonas sp.]|uniref:SixA phosphatase family protein n=1 Tax=uncultured Brevundimonas sp. TaxID=213418 RepID=UPI0025F89E45|nr:phosphoglycerate mutase family protein [uncultured Brevundimonas sp.]
MTRLFALVATVATLVLTNPAVAQTVILVRHAEKADQSTDPVLSEAGQARAEALAARLSTVSVDLILTSPLQRTGLTATPSAEASGLQPEAISLEGGTQAHVAAVVERIRAQPEDATVLVVGHSNTIPLIARALGQSTPDMADCEYDRLLTIQLEGQGVFGVTTRYGIPSDCPA